jgi:hypothetical protein
MYPLNMKLTDGIGFAVANDKAEHQALTAQGYGPAYVAPTKATKGSTADAPATTDE